MDREKEIKQEIYWKSQLIKQTRKEILALHRELDMLYGEKHLERGKQKVKKRQN